MSSLKLLVRALSYKLHEFRFRKEAGKYGFSREKVIYPFRQLFHPINVFNDLKYEHKASLGITFVLTVLLFVTQLLDAGVTALLFRKVSPDDVSLSSALMSSVGLLVIWTVCNWATCTLANGEGTLRDIWVMTTYSVLPYCATTLLSVGISYVLSADETIFYSIISGIGMLWTGILLFLGMLTAHQYTVLKTIISITLTLVMIVLCLFLLVIIYSITQQIGAFGFSIFKELAVRR